MQILNHLVMKDGQVYMERKAHLKAEMIARMYVDGDYSIEDVMAHYNLTAAEVHAAIAYYYDNKPELDAEYERILAEIHDNAMSLDKFKMKIAARNRRDQHPES